MLEAQIDYLEFMLPQAAFHDLLELLPGGLEPLDRGWRGYTRSALVAGGKGRVGWALERPEMGIHVSLGSQALGVFAGLDPRWADLPAMLATLREDMGGRISRIDLAWDDRDGLLDLDLMEGEVRAGNMTTRWKGGHRRWGWGKQAGETMYFGSPASDAMLRVYNKRQERIAKGFEDQVEGVDHWVRVELQLRRKRADAAAADFQRLNVDRRKVFRKLAGVLRSYLEFKRYNATDSNKRRWAPAEWWLTFLGNVEKAKLTVETVKRTVEQVKAWLSSQVAPSLALLEKAMGAERARSYLAAEAVESRARLGYRHRAILRETEQQKAEEARARLGPRLWAILEATKQQQAAGIASAV